jgi:RNA polymerase sigma-70 factor (ECF subfamily)
VGQPAAMAALARLRESRFLLSPRDPTMSPLSLGFLEVPKRAPPWGDPNQLPERLLMRRAGWAPEAMDVHEAVVTSAAGEGLEGLYRRDGARLWRAVMMYTGDREVASDAVAEAFAQALQRGEAIRNPGPWVWRAAFKIAAGELKRRRRTAVLHHPEPAPDPELPILLREVMAVLSPKQRAAVILHHYAGYPVRDVARIIGSTSSAVGVHLHRGRERLRRLLEDADV